MFAAERAERAERIKEEGEETYSLQAFVHSTSSIVVMMR
jgi:hypothetical protein